MTIKLTDELAKEIEDVLTRASYFSAEATDYVHHPTGKRYLNDLSDAAIKAGDELSKLIADESGDGLSAVRANLLGSLRRTDVRTKSGRVQRSLIRNILATIDELSCEDEQNSANQELHEEAEATGGYANSVSEPEHDDWAEASDFLCDQVVATVAERLAMMHYPMFDFRQFGERIKLAKVDDGIMQIDLDGRPLLRASYADSKIQIAILDAKSLFPKRQTIAI
ncbi:MAG TPA: hypothetical protein DDW52_14940 [Planctomycetaceae bacterium]|nr:hypothetical protein [Planctomycetaceae bacterium]